MIGRFAVPMGALLALFAGCEAVTESDETSYEVYDSLGITVSMSHGPAWSAESGWTVSTAPLVVIGSRDGGDPNSTFGRIGGVSVLSDGRIAVADDQASAIRVFAGDGTFLNSLGGPGEGPDEFQRLDRIARIHGDSIVARDVGAFKTVTFAADGSGFRTTRGPSMSWNGLRAVYVAGWEADGTALVSHTPQRSDYPPGEAIVSNEWHRFSPEGVHLGMVGSLPNMRTNNTGEGAAPLTLSSRARIAGASEGFWHAFPESVEIVHYGADGVDRIVRTSYVPPEVPRDLRDSYTEWFASVNREAVRDAPAEIRELVEARIAQLTFADRFAPFTRLLLSAEGHLWLENHESIAEMRAPDWSWLDGSATSSWTVLDPDGRWLGSVELPTGLELRAVSGDRLVGVTTDEFDVQYVAVHELVRTP
jgi:hypothetical protein